MANGSLTVTITDIPATGNTNAGGASNALAVNLLNQVAQQIGSSGALSGNIMWPPGNAPQIVGSWVYSPAS